MPALFPWSRPLGWTLGLLLCASASAQEHDLAGHGAASAAATASGPATGAVEWPDSPARNKAGRGPRDPMEMLRERLAQKLGAVKAPGTDNGNVVRVVAKTSMTAASSVPVPDARTASAASLTRKPKASEAATRDLSKPAVVGSRNVGARGPLPDPLRDRSSDPPADRLPNRDQWSYEGHAGPQAWAQLAPEFAKCANGSRQSPIDIRDGIKVELDEVHFDYRPGGFRVVDDGHTVQVNVASGNSIEVLGRHYELVQFHFHRPSEERIDGRPFDMAVHLVHQDPEGRLAVVAVLLQRGGAQPLVQSVWNNLPLEKGEELAARVALDPNDLLPAHRGYYAYMGSLTTPPCSEGVLWMVMKQPVEVSDEQIGVFARLYPMNARPIQSAAGRLIKESN